MNKHDDLRLGIVDITDSGWEAPVLEQFGVDRLPYFLLYDGEGTLVAEGQEAYRRVMRWKQ